MEFEYQSPAGTGNSATEASPAPLPLGRLVLPAIRWVLRRHTLQDDEPTRSLYRKYILSADHVAQEFSTLLDNTNSPGSGPL